MKVAAATVFVSPWLVRAQAKPTCRAVIVAVTQYQGGFTSEPTLVRALPLVEAALREFARRGGYSEFQVATHTDAALAGAKPARDSDILRGVADAARASAPGDALFVYFTGHGTTAPDGRMFLHTSQADDVVPADRIDLREQLVRLIARLSFASVNMLIIDACRSPAGVGGLGAPNPLVSSVEALRSIEAQGVATLLAASALETAWINRSTGYGYFTEELLAALQAPDLSNAQQLVSIVRPRVAQRVKDAFPAMNRLQNPVLSVADSGGGPYLLRVRAAGAAATGLSPSQPLPVQVKSFLSTDQLPIRLDGPTVWEFPGQEVRLGGNIRTNGHALTIRALRLVGQNAALVAAAGPAASGVNGTKGRPGREGTGAGQAGEDGRAGGDGEHGEPGRVGGDLHIEVQEMTGSFVIDTSGQVGGNGGRGGDGGVGGRGAQGEASRPGIFDCASGPGFGGRGGAGGKGGDGGNGGNGGRAGSVRIEVRRTFNVTLAVSARGGAGGRPGAMGVSGAGGGGGSEGEARGLCKPSGRQGAAGTAGQGGRDGRTGEPGGDGQIVLETPAIAKTVAGELRYTNVQ